MLITIYAVSSALLFALTFLFRKQALNYISVPMAFFIEAFVYLLLPAMYILFTFDNQKNTLNTIGVIFAVLAGIFVVMGVVLNFLALKSGYLSKIIAITSPSQIIFGVLLGFLILREHLTLAQSLGVILSIAGIVLITR